MFIDEDVYSRLSKIETELKDKLGRNNVEVEVFRDSFCVVVRNAFGYGLHWYVYDELKTVDIVSDALKSYICKGDKHD